jgi:acetyl esterase/lipase
VKAVPLRQKLRRQGWEVNPSGGLTVKARQRKLSRFPNTRHKTTQCASGVPSLRIFGIVPAALRAHLPQPRHPFASPIFADLKGLPPIYLQVGEDETLLDDSRALADRAIAAGVDARLEVFPGMLHSFQMMAGRAPEADDAIARFAQWVRPKLGLVGAAASGGSQRIA